MVEGVGLVEISLFDIIESKEAANTDKKMHSHYEVKTHWIFFFFSWQLSPHLAASRSFSISKSSKHEPKT